MVCLIFFIISVYFMINVHEVLSISNKFQNNAYSTQELRRNIRDFFSLKVGKQQKQSVWYYTGVIRSSLNGIAGIEGVELVNALEQEPKRFQVGNTSEPTSETYEQSYISKKVFVYVKKDNISIPYTEHRMRHHAPLRKVNPLKSFSEKVSIGGSSKDGMYASIEWPGSKRTMITNKISIFQSPLLSWMDRRLGRRKLHVSNFMSAVSSPLVKQKTDSSSSRLQAIAKWVSFSSTGAAQTCGRTQEYYTISNTEVALAPQTAAAGVRSLSETHHTQNQNCNILLDKVSTGTDSNISVNPSRNSRVFSIFPAWLTPIYQKPEAVLEYRRYGESPAWYALGQSCAIELQGYRYPQTRYLPSRVRALLQAVDPTFFHTTPCSSSSCGSSSNTSIATCVVGAEEKDLLTMEWFAQQCDPADSYLPWYAWAAQRWRTGWASLVRPG